MKALNWTYAIASLVVPPIVLFTWISLDLHNGGGFGSLLMMLLSVPLIIVGLIPGMLVMIAVAKSRGRAKMLSYMVCAPLVWIESVIPGFAMSDYGDTRSPSYLENPLGVSADVAGTIFQITALVTLAGWILLYVLAIMTLVRTLRAAKAKRMGPPPGGPGRWNPNAPQPQPQPQPSTGSPAELGGPPRREW